MYKFHKMCWNTTLSPDRRSGKRTTVAWLVLSDRPLEDRTTFTCKLSGLSDRAKMGWPILPVLGVTTHDPALLPDPPHLGSVVRVSSVVLSNGSLHKNGRTVGACDVWLEPRDPTELGVRIEGGEVQVYQDGVYKGVMDTGLRGPVWAVVFPFWYDTVSVICKDGPDPRCLASSVQYKSDSRPRGYAVIFNMSQFINKTDRLGSEHDFSRLKELFTKLHFTVLAYENLTAKELNIKLRDISKDNDLPSHDCFTCVLMSHGGKGYIYGADGRKVKLKKIYQKFSNHNCPALKRKPKLFFIQACSGGRRDYGTDDVSDGDSDDSDAAEWSGDSDESDESDGGAKIPTNSDVLVVKATLGGYKSYRHKDRGSRFIQSLGDVFEQHAKDLDVMEMLYKVIDDVQQKATHKTQCPIVKFTFSKKLYLCPDQQASPDDMDLSDI